MDEIRKWASSAADNAYSLVLFPMIQIATGKWIEVGNFLVTAHVTFRNKKTSLPGFFETKVWVDTAADLKQIKDKAMEKFRLSDIFLRDPLNIEVLGVELASVSPFADVFKEGGDVVQIIKIIESIKGLYKELFDKVVSQFRPRRETTTNELLSALEIARETFDNRFIGALKEGFRAGTNYYIKGVETIGAYVLSSLWNEYLLNLGAPETPVKVESKVQYVFDCIEDERTCRICKNLDGTRYYGSTGKSGVEGGVKEIFKWAINMDESTIAARVHPYCRCVLRKC